MTTVKSFFEVIAKTTTETFYVNFIMLCLYWKLKCQRLVSMFGWHGMKVLRLDSPQFEEFSKLPHVHHAAGWCTNITNMNIQHMKNYHVASIATCLSTYAESIQSFYLQWNSIESIEIWSISTSKFRELQCNLHLFAAWLFRDFNNSLNRRRRSLLDNQVSKVGSDEWL